MMRESQRASARHAPDVVKSGFDVGEHRDGDVKQQQHSDYPQRAALRVLDEIMDPFRQPLFAR